MPHGLLARNAPQARGFTASLVAGLSLLVFTPASVAHAAQEKGVPPPRVRVYRTPAEREEARRWFERVSAADAAPESMPPRDPMEHLADVRALGEKELDALAQRRSDLLPRLRKVLTSGSEVPERIGAASLLVFLGEEGAAEALDRLRGEALSNPAWVDGELKALERQRAPPPGPRTRAALIPLLASSRGAQAEAALRVFRARGLDLDPRELPGTSSSDSAPGAREFAWACHPEQSGAREGLLGLLAGEDWGRDGWKAVDLFARALRRVDERERGRLLDPLLRCAARARTLPGPLGTALVQVCQEFASREQAEAMAALADRLLEDEDRIALSRLLVRLEPAVARGLARRWLGTRKTSSDGAWLLFAVGSDAPERDLAALRSAAAKLGGRPPDAFVIAAAGLGTDDGSAFVKEVRPNPTGPLATSLSWVTGGVDPESAVAALRMGTPAPGHSEYDTEPMETLDPWLQVVNRLHSEGWVLFLDPETGEIPADATWILRYLSARVLDAPRVEDIAAEVHALEGDDDEWAGPQTLQFRMGLDWYRVELRWLDDWCDLTAIREVMDAAWAANGRPERVQMLEVGGQYCALFAADPKELAPVVRRFNLPLLDDFDTPLRCGLAGDKLVRGALEREGFEVEGEGGDPKKGK